MKKEDLLIFLGAVLLTGGIIGGVHWYYLQQQQRIPTAPSRGNISNDPSRAQSEQQIEALTRPQNIKPRTRPRANRPNGATSSLERAGKQIKQRWERQAQARRQQPNTRRKPNLRLTGEDPPRNLKPECRFPVGRAKEIERMLSAAKDPRKSTWRKEYCEMRAEARRERCGVPRSVYYYAELCP